jgi:hypothetical protein
MTMATVHDRQPNRALRPQTNFPFSSPCAKLGLMNFKPAFLSYFFFFASALEAAFASLISTSVATMR